MMAASALEAMTEVTAKQAKKYVLQLRSSSYATMFFTAVLPYGGQKEAKRNKHNFGCVKTKALGARHEIREEQNTECR